MTDTLSSHLSTPHMTHSTLHPSPTATSTTTSTSSSASRPIDPLADFATYEDYLDSQLTADDYKYIESEDIMRALVELGYRGTQDTLKRDEFQQRKANTAALLHNNNNNNNQTNTNTTAAATSSSVASSLSTPSAASSSSGALPPKLLTHTLASRPLTSLPPFLRALAEREESIRTGRLSCIAYLRHHNAKGQEVSGYIDINDRMRVDEWSDVWDGRRKVTVKSTDLSYYNWDSGIAANTHSPNWQVKVDDDDMDVTAAATANSGAAAAASNNNNAGSSGSGGAGTTEKLKQTAGGSGSLNGLVCPASAVKGGGLLFKNKRDRKCMSVDPDPSVDCGDNSRRVVIETSEYVQCVIYDHMTRRKM